MKKNKIVFRSDGNVDVGLGHITRSLALADMLNSKFQCVFATQSNLQGHDCKISSVCQSVTWLPANDRHFEYFLVSLGGNEIVVLDNYYYCTDYQKAIRDKGCKIVCIDDMHDKHFVAELIINHSPNAKKSDYSAESYTQFLLGLDYVLLRRKFQELAQEPRLVKDSANGFVCFGGSDFSNFTLQVVNILSRMNSINKVNVVVGSQYLYISELRKFTDRYSSKFKVFVNVSENEIVQIMKNSSFAIVPSSSILLECMAAKLKILTGYCVDNQREFADYIEKKTDIRVVGDFNENMCTEKDIAYLLNESVEHQIDLIDGMSHIRLLEAFEGL